MCLKRRPYSLDLQEMKNDSPPSDTMSPVSKMIQSGRCPVCWVLSGAAIGIKCPPCRQLGFAARLLNPAGGGGNYAVGADQKYAENTRKNAEIFGKYAENMRSIFGRNGLSNFARPKRGDQNLEANKKFTTTENKTHEMMMRSWGKKVLPFTSRKKKPSTFEVFSTGEPFCEYSPKQSDKVSKNQCKLCAVGVMQGEHNNHNNKPHGHSERRYFHCIEKSASGYVAR